MTSDLMVSTALIRTFGCEEIDSTNLPLWDSDEMKELWGGKGAGNIRMREYLKLPVPPGFVISTQVCTYFYGHNRTYPAGFEDMVRGAVRDLEQGFGRRFGDTKKRPLLVSVRSGARRSLPGMMDTLLNIGINDDTVVALARLENERFAYDTYRQCLVMFGETVFGVNKSFFDKKLELFLEKYGIVSEDDLDGENLKALVEIYKQVIVDAGYVFPQDTFKQLMDAICAVFGSWMNQRAIEYREIEHIPESWGTAVTVQAMVFGNLNDNSATGVLFSRNPKHGAKERFGDCLFGKQGESVVDGSHTTCAITEKDCIERGLTTLSLESVMPEIVAQLDKGCDLLEAEDTDMQDIEFTVEDGKLWFLQHRVAKRNARAALKCVVDIVNEGLISKKEAFKRIDQSILEKVLHTTISPKARAKAQLMAIGVPGSPGAVSGFLALSCKEVFRILEHNKDAQVILVTRETNADYIKAMRAAAGVLTQFGGPTSHAAVVMRGWNKPSVVGAGSLEIDLERGTVTGNKLTIHEGGMITIDGSNGEILLGEVEATRSEAPPEMDTFLEWAEALAPIEVRANADTVMDACRALAFRAKGIGLFRPEHAILSDEELLFEFRKMVLADSDESRIDPLKKMGELLRKAIAQVMREMDGLPITIRLNDPPLHEFLPKEEAEIEALAREMDLSVKEIHRRIASHVETNPMMGYRGVRPTILIPGLLDMQALAIFGAAHDAHYSQEAEKLLEIMVPFVFSGAEIRFVRERVFQVACGFERGCGVFPLYSLGSMIELPAAAVSADEMAQEAEFLSCGTNDLTQFTLSISRDDSVNIIEGYREKGILKADPFVTIHPKVQRMLTMTVEQARAKNPDIKIGICGEHGGDPESIAFFLKAGMNYVSCSPYRVPIAWLTLARLALGLDTYDQ